MGELVKKLLPFYLVAFVFLIIVALTVFFTDKTATHLAVNTIHSGGQDFFFRYYTHLADGLTIVILTFIISLFFLKRGWLPVLILGTINLVLVGAIVQSLKQFVFYNALRPSAFIVNEALYTVPGVNLHIANSFPSGHSAAAFAFFSFLAYLLRTNKRAQIICGIAAILAAYSRVYLSQHFLEDILFGGVIGLGCFFFSYLIMKGWLKRSFEKN